MQCLNSTQTLRLGPVGQLQGLGAGLGEGRETLGWADVGSAAGGCVGFPPAVYFALGDYSQTLEFSTPHLLDASGVGRCENLLLRAETVFPSVLGGKNPGIHLIPPGDWRFSVIRVITETPNYLCI